MSNSCRISDPSKCGNVYYKGEWDYCPEYNIGDLVMCNSLLYLCLEHNAGKDPNGNKDYWHCISGGANPDPVPIGRIILDGGFSSTPENDYTDLSNIDGGGSNGRIFKPLIQG